MTGWFKGYDDDSVAVNNGDLMHLFVVVVLAGSNSREVTKAEVGNSERTNQNSQGIIQGTLIPAKDEYRRSCLPVALMMR